MDVLKNIFDFFTKSPIHLTIFLIGIFLLISPFISYNNNGLKVQIPDWISIIGIIIIAISFFMMAINLFDKSNKPILQKAIYTKKINDTTISLMKGIIEDSPFQSEHSGIVIPVDGKFSTDCFSDRKTVAYSIFSKYHLTKIKEIKTYIEAVLKNNNFFKNNNYYERGTTIILPDAYNTPSKIILTVTAVFSSSGKKETNPEFISSCINKVFSITRENRIDTLLFPVIGSGRGDMTFRDALINIVSNLSYYLKHFNHVKMIYIYFLPKDKEIINSKVKKILEEL